LFTRRAGEGKVDIVGVQTQGTEKGKKQLASGRKKKEEINASLRA